jgi:cytochrome c oxidase accessory protein FixG
MWKLQSIKCLMTINRYQPWRRIVRIIEAALILGIPFIKIKGESALRFDIPSLKLHFFGISLWMDEFFVVLTGTIFLTFLFILITLLFGRIWCGWLCPQTVINELTSFIDDKRKGLAGKLLSWLPVLLLSMLVGANLIWYFVSPYDFFQDLFRWEMGQITWGFWISITAIMFLNFSMVRYMFCATVCPYSKLQGAIFDDKTLIIAMDPERKDECIDCLACTRTCPVNIDIRDGLNSACINCAKCIDACSHIMNKRDKGSLIDYFFGIFDRNLKWLRTNVVLTGLVTIFFLILTLNLFYTRNNLDMTVLPNNAFPPRINAKGHIINAYILSIRNKGKDDLDIHIRTGNAYSSIKIVPESTYSVKAGEMQKFPVYITIEQNNSSREKQDLNILVINIDTGKILLEKTVRIIDPEG